MLFTRTSLIILVFLQKAFTTPIIFVLTSTEIALNLNPIFRSTPNKYFPTRQKFIWKIGYYFFVWLNIFAFARLIFLLNHWKYCKDFEQVGYYIIVFALSVIAIEACYTIETYADMLPGIFAQRFKMVKHDFKSKYIYYCTHFEIYEFHKILVFVTQADIRVLWNF